MNTDTTIVDNEETIYRYCADMLEYEHRCPNCLAVYYCHCQTCDPNKKAKQEFGKLIEEIVNRFDGEFAIRDVVMQLDNGVDTVAQDMRIAYHLRRLNLEKRIDYRAYYKRVGEPK